MKVEPTLPRDSEVRARNDGARSGVRAGAAAREYITPTAVGGGPYKASGLVGTLMILGILQVVGAPAVFIWLQIILAEVSVPGAEGLLARGLISLPVAGGCLGVFLAGVAFLAMGEIVQGHVDARNELAAQRVLMERLVNRPGVVGSRDAD